jgi:succinate dehydrogenase/fumarate reductase flavoprotein subunit
MHCKQRRGKKIDVIDAIVEVDVLVIGSGAGGGVSASVLAEAGFVVLVVEKGAYLHPHDIPRADDEALLATYEHGMLTSTSDSGVLRNCVVVGGKRAGNRKAAHAFCDTCLLSSRMTPHSKHFSSSCHLFFSISAPTFC